MTTMKIEYDFGLPPEYKGGIGYYDIDSGFRITIDGIIITKSLIGVDENDGFVGDNFINILCSWLHIVPELLAGKYYDTIFIETTETIDFTPKNGMIYVRFWEPEDPLLASSDNERERNFLMRQRESNSIYPNYPDGTPVPPAVLVNEIIRVSEDFIAYIEPHDTKKGSGIASLRDELKKVKEFWKEKSKEYTNPAGNN
jgi:hypothetical protein